jgi:hypothetical protein
MKRIKKQETGIKKKMTADRGQQTAVQNQRLGNKVPIIKIK